jgi:hypothetical protein
VGTPQKIQTPAPRANLGPGGRPAVRRGSLPAPPLPTQSVVHLHAPSLRVRQGSAAPPLPRQVVAAAAPALAAGASAVQTMSGRDKFIRRARHKAEQQAKAAGQLTAGNRGLAKSGQYHR